MKVNLNSGLYIVATPIGNMGDISLRALEVLSACDEIYCEDTRVTVKLLERHDIRGKRLSIYNDHSDESHRNIIIDAIRQEQKAIALVSDAGMPLLSDPGNKLVRAVQEAGLYYTVLSGASSITSALVLSGLPTDSFYFQGFLPNKSHARANILRDLVAIKSTLIFFERAERIEDVLKQILEIFGNIEVALVKEISKMFEAVVKVQVTDILSKMISKDTSLPMIKGEFVLLLNNRPKSNEQKLDEEEVFEIIKKMAGKNSTKDIVAMLINNYNMSKKQAYQMVLDVVKQA